ncbi:DUF4157 domain-containing protein [Candidatus Poribacteria bacterium]|nr:DUF4157 domain-containing protein [Candidatus Poribacteria bacterium]
MQQRMNDPKFRQKQDLQSNIQIRKKTEEADALMRDYNPLQNITCKIGDNACAAKHVSLIQRTGLFHPMNESRRVQSLLRLQQQYGNRFVQRVLAQHAIQTRLQVSQPGDIYEREAERVAERVMQMPEPETQRQPAEEEEELQMVQRQPQEEEEEMQMKELPGQNSEVTPKLESRINALKGGGQPLPISTRSSFEQSFGYDFSQVRVHTDAEADNLNNSLNAQAFTTGQDVFFRQGAYNPGSSSGQKLLAHELTHVAQQNGDKA